MAQTQTLSSYLTRANPTVLIDGEDAAKKLKKSGGRGSTRVNDVTPVVTDVRKWKEFTRENLEKCFGGELGRALRKDYGNLQSFSRISPEFREVVDEESLRGLLIKYHQSVVLEALEKTSHRMLRQHVSMTIGRKAVLIYDKDGLNPDFAGIKRVEKRKSRYPKPHDILPGDAKPSWVWSSKVLRKAQKMASEDRKLFELKKNRGISQVVKYSILASARYGYILTDKELFVFRVQPKDQINTEPADNEELRDITLDNPVLYYASIPWARRGDRAGNLTIDVALWALHLIAANDGYLQFKYKKALRDEVVVDPAQQKVPWWNEISSIQTPSEQEDFPTVQPPINPGDDSDDTEAEDEPNDDEDEQNEAEEEEEQDTPIFSAGNSFNGMESLPSPSTQKRKWAVTEEFDNNIDMNNLRRDTLSPQSHHNRTRTPAMMDGNVNADRDSFGVRTRRQLRELTTKRP